MATDAGMLRIKNWEKFQHYKHRCPPWIKLAADTFQNPNFSCLQDASKLLAVCIWTLASRSQDGTVPDNFEYIKQWGFLGESVEKKHFNELIETGFLIRACNMLASCTHDASKLHTNADSEIETETETETENTVANEAILLPKKQTPQELKAQLRQWAETRKMQ